MQELAIYAADTSRRCMIASVTLMVIIAVLDSFLRGILAILFVLPLILLAHGGTQRQLRWVAGVMFVLTFVAYFIKIQFIPQPPNTQFFDFRIINRGFTALMILALGRMLQLWIGWREDQNDPELSEPLRSQDLEISQTVAVMCCVPLLAIIAFVDIMAPANVHVAILYPIPLLICGWTRSRKLVWGMLAGLILLSMISVWLGPPSTIALPEFSIERNRILAASTLIAIAITLHIGLAPDRFSRRYP
jgi:hypothetical protein